MTLGSAAALLIVAVWWYGPTLSTRAPHPYRVEIDTPGGPALLKLTFWPNSRGTRWSAHLAQSGPPVKQASFDGFALAQTLRYDPKGGLIEVAFPDGPSSLRLKGDPEHGMTGAWTVLRPDGPRTLPARAWKHGPSGFPEIPGAGPPRTLGEIGRFRDPSDGAVIELALFTSSGHPAVTAEAVAGLETRDYLHGRLDNGLLRLTHFDGRHAYLIVISTDAQGGLTGELWDGDWQHRRLEPLAP